MKEIWKDCVGYPNYEVSSLGNVSRNGKILKGGISTKGYKIHSICVSGKQSTKSAHTLILRALKGEKPKGFVGRHLNSNRTDNRISNLEWSTHKENFLDRISFGTYPMGENAGTSKLTWKGVSEIRRLFKRVSSHKSNCTELMAKFNVDRSTILKIIKGKTWNPDFASRLPRRVK